MGDITAKRLMEAMNGLKAVEVCEMSGVSKYSISQYMHGKNAPDNANATKLGKALGVNPLWLMGYDVPKESADDNYLMYNGEKISIPSEVMDYVIAIIKAKK